jgi:hypothetical protein
MQKLQIVPIFVHENWYIQYCIFIEESGRVEEVFSATVPFASDTPAREAHGDGVLIGGFKEKL